MIRFNHLTGKGARCVSFSFHGSQRNVQVNTRRVRDQVQAYAPHWVEHNKVLYIHRDTGKLALIAEENNNPDPDGSRPIKVYPLEEIS